MKTIHICLVLLTLSSGFLSKIVTENNILTGSIPTEVGLLTDLTYLSLSKHLFSVFYQALDQNRSAHASNFSL